MTPDDLRAAAWRRLLALDPLLPAWHEPPAGCGATFTAADDSGRLTGVATCDHWTGEPGSMSLTWGAAHRFSLRPSVAGQDIGGALDQLITKWQEHLAGIEEVKDADSAAVVTWPSRDVEGIRALLAHGLAPLAVIAARTARSALPPFGRADGITIRRAGPADLDAVTDLGLDLVRYDAYFGEVVERPHTEEGLRRDCEGLLAGPAPWAWLAERDGVPVGLVVTEPPETAQWIAPLTGLSPVAYLQQGIVRTAERASGIGADLVAHCHAELDAAGIAITLLHYSQANPLSVPFWSQQGYRPLWTTWEARPALNLR